jgi:hypothetical protein
MLTVACAADSGQRCWQWTALLIAVQRLKSSVQSLALKILIYSKLCCQIGRAFRNTFPSRPAMSHAARAMSRAARFAGEMMMAISNLSQREE